jgi:Flp pilus assembly protein TadD
LAAKSLPAVALAASVVILMAAEVPRQPLFQANAALQAGEADKALTLLDAVRNSVSNRAEAENLECRVRFTLEQWNAAVAACQEAVNLDGENSDYHMWLGRALGEKAGRASFLSAFSLAKRARNSRRQFDLDRAMPRRLRTWASFTVLRRV